MKNTRKISIALVIVMVLMLTLAVIPASAANIEGGTVLYLVPSKNWNESGARFAAYFFGNGEAWASMTKVQGETNLYQVTVPAGSWTNVIFCRMNPAAATNNWNNKWNQTSDLVYNGTSNCYTVAEGTWDKGGGTWSTYGNSCAHNNLGPAATCTTPQVCNDCGDPVVSALGHKYNADNKCSTCNGQATFTVAGNGAHLGTEWDTGNTANDMTYANGVYIKTYNNVAAGSYLLKVARDHDWGTAYPGEDLAYTVKESGTTITVMLQGTTVTVTEGEPPHVHSFGADGSCECGFNNTKPSILYLKNTAGWTLVQCYAWDANDTNNTWPGATMTLVAGTTDIYRVELAPGFMSVIFHNKVPTGEEGMYEGAQTADLLIPANGCIIFDNSANTWAEYHNPETVPGKAPTCKDTGYTESSKCSDCGKVLTEATELPVSGEHAYVPSVKEPTCTDTGLTTYTCSACGHSYTEEIPAAGHSYDESAWGYKGVDGHAHTCSCGAKDTVLPHNPNADAPTEQSAKYCLDCGYVIEAALGHVCDISVLMYDAEGHWYKCTGCENTSEKAAHEGGEATCTAPKTCTVCNQSYGSALGHSMADATCTSPKTCSTCGATEGKANGHSWTEATCTSPKTCSTCGATEGNAKGHSWTEATCTSPKTCSTCGATEGNAKGHSFNEGKCSCGATDPNYVPEVETPDNGETDEGDVDENPVEPELSFFEKIWQAILAFFQKILDFFK